MDGIIDSVDTSLNKTPEDSEGQGSLACCRPGGRKESDTTEQVNNNTNLARARVHISEHTEPYNVLK